MLTEGEHGPCGKAGPINVNREIRRWTAPQSSPLPSSPHELEDSLKTMSLRNRTNSDQSAAPKAKRIKVDKTTSDARAPARTQVKPTIGKASAAAELDFPEGMEQT